MPRRGWRTEGPRQRGEADIRLARDIQDRRASRKIEVVPQYLLTNNWADSGPGFSWPVAYETFLYGFSAAAIGAGEPDGLVVAVAV